MILESAPFQSCHASTLCETPDGILAAWFAGSSEGEPDVGIWLSRWVNQANGGWSAPEEVATGILEDGGRLPCWNPVLFQYPGGPLLLFYKMGPSPTAWWGLVKQSLDHGKTWSDPIRLPDGILGPIKNKPVLLPDGRLLCPSSTETGGEWCVHIESTRDYGATWDRSGSLNDPMEFSAIQPAILIHGLNEIQILCRSKQKRILESWSSDGGMTWTPMRPTSLLNPDSGIDALQLRDGRSLLIYNPSEKERTPLVAAISPDGKEWRDMITLESAPGEYSYPAVIQASDGRVHVTYTWNRININRVVINTPLPG